MWLKRMIERCIGRARSGACSTCDHKEACAAGRWQEAFAVPGGAPAAAAPSFFDGLAGLLSELGAAIKSRPAAAESSFRRQVEEAIEPLLPSGQANVERAALALGVSRQTLYRRLKAQGVTFEQLLDELRHRRALDYLRKEGLGVKQTAYRLGFSDPAAFSRAFKRWTGRSPSQARG